MKTNFLSGVLLSFGAIFLLTQMSVGVDRETAGLVLLLGLTSGAFFMLAYTNRKKPD